MSFSKRLNQAIESRNISQAEAARLCGISQQSMNYILSKNLKSSKQAPQIADALSINPEWLIYGEGRPEIVVTYELPIIHSPYMLKKFIADTLSQDTLEFTVIDSPLGKKSFAYLLKPKQMMVCSERSDDFDAKQYLTLKDDDVVVTSKPNGISFPIFESRERYKDF